MRCACRHNDFGNNTVLFPARNPRHWGQPEEVQSILYYGDFDGDDSNHAGGGTAFAPVSRTDQNQPQIAIWSSGLRCVKTSAMMLWAGARAHAGRPPEGRAPAGILRRKPWGEERAGGEQVRRFRS